MRRLFIGFLQKLRILSAISIRLTKLTGKSKEAVHPKHLVDERPWYVKCLSSKDIVLDLGCANGQHTLKAAKYVKKIIGVDVNKEELSKAKREANRQKIKNAHFFAASAEEKLKFKDQTFDKVLFLDVLEHLRNRDLALSEVFRVLKERGLLLLAVPNKNTSWKKLQRSVGLNSFADHDHKIEYSKDELPILFKKHRFSVKLIQPIVYDTPLAPVFDFIGGLSLGLYKKLLRWKKDYVGKHPDETTGFEIIAEK